MSTVTRSVFLIAAMLLLVGLSVAQIPNAGFENWANGDPVSWSTGNGLYTFVIQSSSAHGGTSAAQGNVVSMGGFNLSAMLITTDNAGVGFPVSQRYASLHGFYKFTPASGDAFYVSYLAQKGTSGVGAGAFVETSAQSVYKEFVAPIIYPGADVPDNGIISFFISHAGGFPNVGSTFIVDDISFGPTGVSDDLSNRLPAAFRLEQNYPNPFNPTTNIVYTVPGQTRVRLTVLDLLGREVAVVVDQLQSAGRYKAVFDASALTSGVYFYRLTAGNFVDTGRMVVLK